ncbi:MAG: ribosome maturation factor RimM, partial [Bacilli bacterium]
MKLNLVGVITSTHGIKGEVKVKSDTSFDRFNVGN